LAISLIKMVITANNTVTASVTTDTTTSVVDGVARFVAFVSSGMIDTVTHTTTITAADFVDDQGNPVAPDDLPVPPIGGYYNVYVNGVLQEGGLTQLTNSQLVLSTDQISLDVPVMVEVHDYSGTTSSSVSTASVDVQTDIIT